MLCGDTMQKSVNDLVYYMYSQIKDGEISIDTIHDAVNRLDNEIFAELCYMVYKCTQCKLHTSCSRKVFSEGPFDSPLVIIGEGPGEVEDQTGRPFVGPAGQLLDKLLIDASIDRSKVYITNAVKCRPVNNATPKPEEINACSNWLVQELMIVRPKFVIAMGSVAASLFSNQNISQLAGKVVQHGSAHILFTYHPAYIVRKKGEDFDKLYLDVLSHISLVTQSLAEQGYDIFLIENE